MRPLSDPPRALLHTPHPPPEPRKPRSLASPGMAWPGLAYAGQARPGPARPGQSFFDALPSRPSGATETAKAFRRPCAAPRRYIAPPRDSRSLLNYEFHLS